MGGRFTGWAAKTQSSPPPHSSSPAALRKQKQGHKASAQLHPFPKGAPRPPRLQAHHLGHLCSGPLTFKKSITLNHTGDHCHHHYQPHQQVKEDRKEMFIINVQQTHTGERSLHCSNESRDHSISPLLPTPWTSAHSQHLGSEGTGLVR